MADTGATSPGTMASVSQGGNALWTNPDNAKLSNGNYAFAALGSSGADTYLLKATNFGFSIPTGATINGIVVEIERYNAQTGPRSCADQEVKINLADDTQGTENKAAAGDWATADPNTYVTYGAVDNLWTEDWEYDDINNSNFGVGLTAVETGGPFGNAVPSVDHIRITVYYTEGAPPAAGTGQYINKGDVLKQVSHVYLNKADVWKNVPTAYINKGDVLKKLY